MSPPPTKLQAEKKAAAGFRPRLRAEARLARTADRLIYRAMELAPQPIPKHHPVAAQSILLARISNDLSAGLRLAQVGYLLQMWAMTSTLIEHAFTVGTIGNDLARADKWFSHDMWERSPWKVSAAIRHTLAYLDIPAERHGELYHRYQQMCAAKHANPVIQRHFGVAGDDNTTRIQLDPRYLKGHVPLFQLGMNYALQAVGIAVWAFAKDRIVDSPFNKQLVAFTTEVIGRHRSRTRATSSAPAV